MWPKTSTRRWFKDPLSLFTACVALFTLILAIIAGIQTWSFIESERAFIGPDSDGVRFAQNVMPGVKRFEMILELKNSGKSVANIEELTAVITHGPLTEEPLYTEAPRFAFPPVVPNGKTARPLSFDIGPKGWSPETAAGVTNGTLPFYFYGRVKYRDTYSWRMIFNPRETGFCFLYAPDYPGTPTFVTCREPKYTYARY
jgi:hypothetical protein